MINWGLSIKKGEACSKSGIKQCNLNNNQTGFEI
jgi:hypothetical protein